MLVLGLGLVGRKGSVDASVFFVLVKTSFELKLELIFIDSLVNFGHGVCGTGVQFDTNT